jgi:aminoglycoside phosphotransferase (APT) family kinase protein
MRLRLLAYKPGRRAVFRAAPRLKRRDRTEETILPLHLQVEHPDTLSRSHRNLCRVHEALPADAKWSVPTPVGVVEDRNLFASSWELGSPLMDSLGSVYETKTLRATASALAGLHGLDIAAAKTVSACRPNGLRSLARDLADLLPEEESRILALGDRLTALEGSLERSGPTVPAHGDFHPGQVLVQYGRVVLVDFDRADHDHAAADIGSFVARLVEAGLGRRSIDPFVGAYREAVDWKVRDADVDAAVAIALFRRATVPFRELARDWPDRMRDRLRRVEDAAGSAR